MRRPLFFLLFLLALNLLPLVGAQSAVIARAPQLSEMASSTESGYCWPQVGVFALGAATVTGASVEIRILTPQRLDDPNSDLAYWVGINLANDAFIQTGYLIEQSNQAQNFWEYFPPGTAKEASVRFLGYVDDSAGTNGTWVKYSIVASGTTWSTFVGSVELGSINLKISSADENSVYAVAEVAGTTRANNVLGPVEFKNLSYRDSVGKWHLAENGRAYIGEGWGSASRCTSVYSFGEIPGVNNYWIAGSISPDHSQSLYTYFADGVVTWPWYQLSYGQDVSCDSPEGWYPSNMQINCQVPSIKPISSTAHESFETWTINGQSANEPDSYYFALSSNMNLGAVYVKQFYVNASSAYGQAQGSGWYDEGSTAKISLKPTTVPYGGVLGMLGVGQQFEGWTGDYSSSNSTAELKVNSAKSIQAEWSTTYGYLPEAIVATMLLVFTLPVLVWRRKVKGNRVGRRLNVS